MTTHTAPTPSWLDGFVDILRARRGTWVVAAVAVVLVAALLALLAPSLLPPTALVGGAVGIAAALLATALVVALDSADLVVRGPRHVAAAGGRVAGTISRAPGDIDALMALIDQHSGDHGVRVALTPASRAAGVPGARANMVAEELARRDLKVLCTDLTRGRTPAVGLSDVLSGQRKLADAVRFDEELFLAHLAVGSEPEAALAGFADWATALPDDLDVLVAALPPLAEPGVLPAVQGVELVLVLVEVDRTERVDLVACLDAIDAAGVPAALVLVDPDLDNIPELSTSVAVLGHAPDEDFHPEDPEARLRTVDLVDAPESSATPAEDADAPSDLLPPDDDEFDDGADDHDLPAHEDEAAAAPDVPGAASEPVERPAPAPSPPDVTPEPAADAADEQDEASGDRSGNEGVRVVAGQAGPARGPAAGARPSAPVRSADTSAYEDDDDPQPPVVGGGHVRTLRARRAAMATVDPAEAPLPPDESAEAPPPPDQAAPDQAAPDQPDSDQPDSDQPASETAPADGGEAAHLDEIDSTAREAARLTASLHALANEVWQRGDG